MWLWVLEQAEHPAALAVTGQNNNPQELSWILTQLGVVLFFYFLVAPVSSIISQLMKFVTIYILIC